MRPLCLAHLTILLGPLLASPALAAVPTDPRPTLFDPARHMRVSEVKPGMKGYGLSVFKGTTIERFGVEILSVLVNFNPKHDVILVRCSGANLEHTGSIQGMSGSPIYLDDGTGKHRMVGAFAYGWPLMKDPVGGVQPIEYMLALRETNNPAPDGHKEDSGRADAGSLGRQRWNVLDALPLPHRNAPPAKHYPFASWNSTKPNPQLGTNDLAGTTRLRPLATPLMTSGLSSRLIEQMRPIFESQGIVPVQAGGVGGRSVAVAGDDTALADIEPGSTLVVPLITGDIDMSAVGTATEVIGEQVFGFGHQFMSEGQVTLPMAAGRIDGVIANLMTSFKLGTVTRSRGTIFTDQMVGVAGKLGDVAPMVPVTLQIVYADGSQDQQYTFQTASHPRFTPLLTIMGLRGAVEGEHDLPQFHTLDYDLTIEFANGKSMQRKNTAVNASAGQLFFEIGAPMMLAANNPFQRVLVKSLTGTITVTPEAREATILSVHVPRLKYRPGETVKAYITYRPFREAEKLLPIEFELPRDLTDGTYQLVVSDWTKFLADETSAKPFRFTAESVDEVFQVMNELSSYRHDAVYVRMVRQGDGVAIGRTAMPNLPSSRREVLIGAGRSNTTPFVSSTTKTIPVKYVMDGSAEFQITVDKDAKVEVGGKPGAKQEPATPATPPAPTEKPATPPKTTDEKPQPGPKPDAPKQEAPAPTETP
ncbi:MAG TPA: hypothetical protein VGR35_08850 [Tepidisphaeraceae bacterium]|nr:hypothetical protein [Tepidisphaeraceae bacterium]